MLSHTGACMQVFLELQRRAGFPSRPSHYVVADQSVERRWGWLFPIRERNAHKLKTYAEVRSSGGAFRVVINKHDASIEFYGWLQSEREIIADYETKLRQKNYAARVQMTDRW